MKNYEKKWILVDKEIVEVDLMTWARWLDGKRNRIASYNRCGVYVSTIFLGIDHSFNFDENIVPILFETMIFGEKPHNEQYRYCTYQQALNSHRRIVHQLDLGFPSNKWFAYHFKKLKSCFKK